MEYYNIGPKEEARGRGGERKKLAKSSQEKMKERMQVDPYLLTDSIATVPPTRSQSFVEQGVVKDGDYVEFNRGTETLKKSQKFTASQPAAEFHYETVGLKKAPNQETYEHLYDVEISPSWKSQQIKLHGSFKLRMNVDSVDLLKKQRRKLVVHISWPIRTIRNYGYNRMIFNFEAGRRSPTGEGKFYFSTIYAKDINDAMKQRIEVLCQHISTPVENNDLYIYS